MPSKRSRTITAEDLYKFNLISTPRISPEGQHVVYSLGRVDPKTEKKSANLWIVPTDGSGAHQFTFGDQSDTQPGWSPDGNQIAFLSNRLDLDKPASLFLIPARGGEARPLGHIASIISKFSWSPDGTRILCRVRKTDQEVLEREEDDHKKKLGVAARHYDRVCYKLDDDGYLPRERWHLWIVEVETGAAWQLTDHPVYDENDPTWSPDGKWIAFTSNRSPSPDLDRDAIDLFVIPAGGGTAQKIETPLGEKSQPSFSPDGRWIAYYGKLDRGYWYKHTDLWIVPTDPVADHAEARNLTGQYDVHISPDVINDMGSAEMMPPAWSNDGRKLYFPIVKQGSSLLKSITMDGDEFQTIIGEGGTVGSSNFDREQNKLVYFLGRMDDPGQIHVHTMSSGIDLTLTNVNRDLLDEIDLGEIEEIWIEGPAGNDLQGWILKPPGADPSKRYASILEIHGGPLTQYGNFFMHEFCYLAAQGYVVHFCNPRGGRGYGEKHAKAIWGGWGGADFDDLMAWTDVIAQKSHIDPDRTGVTGGSYGGYMTVWIIGHTDHFGAAVAQRCVSNLISMWGSSDLNWIFEQELDAGPPFEAFQKYWDYSPIKYIGNASTPTLVIHSENDLRCPIEQGEQVFVALQKLGVESEMVRFPDEFHGLSRTGRTDRRVIRLKHIKRWFDKYLE